MRRLIAIACACSAAIAGLLFRVLVEKPALTPLGNGSYGEMYGPVTFFSPFVYGLLLCVIAASIVMTLFGRFLPNKKE